MMAFATCPCPSLVSLSILKPTRNFHFAIKANIYPGKYEDQYLQQKNLVLALIALVESSHLFGWEIDEQKDDDAFRLTSPDEERS